MSAEQRGPAAGNDCVEMEGRGEMIKAPINLQDLRRRLYVKAKTEPSWRFWGIYAHVCKPTLPIAAAGSGGESHRKFESVLRVH
jgi:hypothetical protein